MRAALLITFVVGWVTTAHADGGALVVVIDRSLPADKLVAVTKALADARDQLDPSQQLAIVSAGKTATVELALQTSSKARIPELKSVPKADLIAALRTAGAQLRNAKVPRRIVIVTDGNDLIPINGSVAKLRADGVKVSAIGFQSLNRITLKEIAASGGGRLYLADDQKAIVDAYVDATRAQQAPKDLAVVVVIDRSGSMNGPKLETAKELARVLLDLLAPSDVISIVTVDTEAQVFVRPQRVANRTRISTEIARITGGGGTNIYPGLKEAFDILKDIANTEKHVILVSDGEAPDDGIVDLVSDMRSAHITVSAVGTTGADRNALSMIADAGDGRLYMIEDVAKLPKLFLRQTVNP